MKRLRSVLFVWTILPMQLYPVGTNFTSNVYTSGFEKTVCVHYAKQLLSQVSKFGV